MKKIISLALCFMLVFSITALADDYDALFEQNNNYSAQFTFTMNAGGAVQLLNTVAKHYELDKFTDAENLVHSLAGSTANGKIALDAQNDFKILKASYEFTFNIPTQINSNLSFESTGRYGMWLDMDISDEMNPKINIVYQSPIMSKFVTLDAVKMIKDQGGNVAEYVSYMKNYLSEEYIKSLNEKCKESLKKNSSIVVGARKSTISVDSEQMKNYLKDIFEIIKQETESSEDYSLLQQDLGTDFWDNVNDAIFDVIDETDMTFTIDLEKDKYDRVFKIKSGYKISFDLADMFEEVDFGSADTAMSITLVSDMIYDRNNRAVVSMPALNDANSMSFEEFFDINTDNINSRYNYISFACKYIPTDEKSLYVELNKITRELKGYGFRYEVDKTSTGLTLTETTGTDSFGTAQFVFGNNDITIDDQKYTVSNPPVDIDGTVFVDTDAVKYVFNLDLDSYNLGTIEELDTASVYFDRPNPNYVEDFDDEYYDEKEQYQYVSVDMPFRGKEQISYNTLRDVLEELECYDITYEVNYDNGTVNIACTSGNDLFTNATIVVGSADIVVDGKTVTCTNPAIEIDDSLYIDDDALMAIFGLENDYGSVYYDTYEARMILSKGFNRTINKK